MKKIFLTVLFAALCVSFTTQVLARGGQEQEMETEQSQTPAQMQVQPFMGQATTSSGIPSEMELKQREMELKKRELKVGSTTGNSSEALKNFEATMKQSKQELQQKMNDAKKQRALCLQGRAQDLKSLEQERKASVSAMMTNCAPKAIQATIEKPVKPVLDGLSAEDKQSALKAYQQSLKDFNTQIKEALKACKVKVQQTHQDFREKMVNIKEQCSNTERTVLGLSTDIPYNANPTVPQY